MKWINYRKFDFTTAKSWHIIFFERLEISYIKINSFKEGQISIGYSLGSFL